MISISEREAQRFGEILSDVVPVRSALSCRARIPFDFSVVARVRPSLICRAPDFSTLDWDAALPRDLICRTVVRLDFLICVARTPFARFAALAFGSAAIAVEKSTPTDSPSVAIAADTLAPVFNTSRRFAVALFDALFAFLAIRSSPGSGLKQRSYAFDVRPHALFRRRFATRTRRLRRRAIEIKPHAVEPINGTGAARSGFGRLRKQFVDQFVVRIGCRHERTGILIIEIVLNQTIV